MALPAAIGGTGTVLQTITSKQKGVPGPMVGYLEC